MNNEYKIKQMKNCNKLISSIYLIFASFFNMLHKMNIIIYPMWCKLYV